MVEEEVTLRSGRRRVPQASSTEVVDLVHDFLMGSFLEIGGELKEVSETLAELPVLPQGLEAFDTWCERERFNVLIAEESEIRASRV